MKRYKFIGNQISIVILIGIAGFIFASILLGARNSSGRIVYHELMILKKDSVINAVYQSRLKTLRDSIALITGDTGVNKTRIAQFRKLINQTLADSINLASNNIDVSDTFFTKKLLISRKTLENAMNADSFGTFPYPLKDVVFTYADTIPAFSSTSSYKEATLQLKVSEPLSMMAFIQRNTLAGVWLIVSIAQMTLWFIIIPLLIGRIKSADTQVKSLPQGLFSILNWLISCIIPIIFLALVSYIFYVSMVDTTVIRNHYFLEGFNTKMIWYAAIGYLVTAGCFGMFLHMSMALDQLDEYAQSAGLSLSANQLLKDNYNVLKNAFNDSFLATSFILSIFVLWLGTGFTAINHTEAMRFYRLYSGSEFLNPDYVYLVGAFHTVILLLFYIPVKVKFNSLGITYQAVTANPANTSKIGATIFESISSLLVTASPLIASLVQKILGSLLAN